MGRRKIACLIAAYFLFAPFQAAAAVQEGNLLDGMAPGADGKIDVLAVFAHQDDESIFAGGTLLKMKRDPRVRLHILCLTLGDKSGAMKRLKITEEEQGRIRPAELEAAAAVFGADSLTQFDYHDQGLAGADRRELVEKIIGVIESTGAEIVITHDPGGVSDHPDHKTANRAVTEAFKKSSAKRLYYATVAHWVYKTMYHGDEEIMKPTIKVDIRKEKKLKRLAMYEHNTQRNFSDIAIEMELIRLFNHEYFVLAADKGAAAKRKGG